MREMNGPATKNSKTQLYSFQLESTLKKKK